MTVRESAGTTRRRTVMQAALVAALACGAGRDRHSAADWPRWRGPDGAGLGVGFTLPSDWTTAPWRWQVPLPGVGHSSPVVAGGRIFTASADEQSAMRFLCCHAVADGALVWRREIPGPIERHHVQNSSASGSVAVGAAGVYWAWATSDNLCVEAFTADGAPLWHMDLGRYECEHGFGASVAVWKDLVIVPIDQDGPSAVVALDAATGRERWRLPRDSASTAYSTPLVLERPDTAPLAVLASTAHGLTGLDPLTGRVLWERRCLPRRTVSSPIAADGLAIATCGEGGGDNLLVALRLPSAHDLAARPSPPLEPEIAYELGRGVAPYVPTPLRSGPRLYLWGDRGVVSCVALADGAPVWRGRVGGMFSASPIVAGDAVINVSADGEVVALRDGEEFVELGRRDLGEPSRASPAVAEDRLILRGASHLFAL